MHWAIDIVLCSRNFILASHNPAVLKTDVVWDEMITEMDIQFQCWLLCPD